MEQTADSLSPALIPTRILDGRLSTFHMPTSSDRSRTPEGYAIRIPCDPRPKEHTHAAHKCFFPLHRCRRHDGRCGRNGDAKRSHADSDRFGDAVSSRGPGERDRKPRNPPISRRSTGPGLNLMNRRRESPPHRR